MSEKSTSILIQAAKKNSISLAHYILMQLQEDGKYLAYERNEQMMYAYNGKYYEPYERIDFDKMLHDFFKQHDITDIWKQGRLAEIKAAMEVNDSCPRATFDDYDNYICLNNGVLNTTTMTLQAHSPQFFFTYAINIDYDPDAPQPARFMSFLEKSFVNPDQTVDYDTIDAIIKIGGYLLYPKNPLEKMFLFLGEGANGKSILLDTYRNLFSDKNVSFLSLEELSGKGAGFERAKLIGSKANFCSEAKSTAVDAEEIKKIVTGDGITINNKYGKVINHIPRCKILMASNTRPYFNDSSHGLMRRLYIIEFKNQFLPETEYNKIKDPEHYRIFKADDRDELTAAIKSEMPGILNMFLGCLKQIHTKEFQLLETANTLEIKEEYKTSNDGVGHFLRENYFYPGPNLTGAEEYYSSTDILDHYREWYRENVNQGSLKFSSVLMGIKIKEVFRIESKMVRKDGKLIRAYKLTRKKDDPNIPVEIEISTQPQSYRDGYDRPTSSQETLI